MNDKEKCLNKLFKEIVDEISNKNVAIFFGAGLSINSGNLSVNIIIDSILESLEYDRTHLFDKDIIKVLKNRTRQFEDFLSRIYRDIDIETNPKQQKFERLFNSLFAVGEPNNNHLTISQLINKGYVTKVYSTNIDTHLEDCYANYCGEVLETFILGSSTNSSAQYFKLHGCISKNKTILTLLDQVAEKSHVERIQKLIEDILVYGEHEIILFMGYSFSDVYDIVKVFENISISKKSNLSKKIVIIAHDNKCEMYSNHITSCLGHELKTINDYNASVNKKSIPTRKIRFDNFPITILKYNTDNFINYVCKKFEIECKIKAQESVSPDEIKMWIQDIDEYYRLLISWRFNYEAGQEYFLIEDNEFKSVMLRSLKNALKYCDLNLKILNKNLENTLDPLKKLDLRKQVIINKKHKAFTLIAMGRFSDAESLLKELTFEIDRILLNDVPERASNGIKLYLKLDINSGLLYLNYCKVLLNKYSKNGLKKFIKENEHYVKSLNIDQVLVPQVVYFHNKYLIAALKNHSDISKDVEIYFKDSIDYFEGTGLVEYLAFVYMEYAKFLYKNHDPNCYNFMKMAKDIFENLGYDEYLRFCIFDH